jgi:hypothetical protein
MEYKGTTLIISKCFLVTIKNVILFEESTYLLEKINNLSNGKGEIYLLLNISISNKKMYQDNEM